MPAPQGEVTLDGKRIDEELQRRYVQRDDTSCCPNCGRETVDTSSGEEIGDSYYREMRCTKCSLDLTVVYRIHYQYATVTQPQEGADYQPRSLLLNINVMDPYSLLLMFTAGMSMAGWRGEGPDENPVNQVLKGLADKIPKEDWPRLLADENQSIFIHSLAKEYLNESR